MHFVLRYEKAPGFEARQSPFSAAHGEHVRMAAQDGALVLAGSLLDPADGEAWLLFETDSRETVEAFANADPYVTAGVVVRWTVRRWDLVIGAERVAPTRAAGD